MGILQLNRIYIMLIFNSQYFSKMFISYLYWPYIYIYQRHINVMMSIFQPLPDPVTQWPTDPPNHGRLWPWTRKSHSWRQPWPMPLRCARRQRAKPWEDGRFAVSKRLWYRFREWHTDDMTWYLVRSWNIHSVDAGCWSCIAKVL